MPPGAPKDRSPFPFLITITLALALLFGYLTIRPAARTRKFQSSFKVLLTPPPPGGLNPTIQARAFNSLSDMELRQQNNVVDITAFAITPEEAKAKAQDAMTKFLRAMHETYGPTNRALVIQTPEPARPVSLLNR